jgi:hypothetical protein
MSPETPKRPRKTSRAAPSKKPRPEPATPSEDDEARLFYDRLEQAGQLVDVHADTDLAALSPRVTHIRHPDGSVERIGFSSSPYGGD